MVSHCNPNREAGSWLHSSPGAHAHSAKHIEHDHRDHRLELPKNHRCTVEFGELRALADCNSSPEIRLEL